MEGLPTTPPRAKRIAHKHIFFIEVGLLAGERRKSSSDKRRHAPATTVAMVTYSGKSLASMFVQVSAFLVEAQRQHHNLLAGLSRGCTRWMASTVLCEACLAAYFCVIMFSVPGSLATHVTVPLPYRRAARSRRENQLGYRSFGVGCPEFTCSHVGRKQA